MLSVDFASTNVIFYFKYRSNDGSYSRGVLSDSSYEYGKKRSLVSIKLCFISWVIELVGFVLFAASYTILHEFGIKYLHYPDCIGVNVVIPLVHLMQDDETKGIIAEENWYQGIRHMLGIHQTKPTLLTNLQTVKDIRQKNQEELPQK